MHLFVDISGHGYGHLAIAAPVLSALAERCPGLRLTVRCALPAGVLRRRLPVDFVHLPGGSDFGFVMRDASHIDLPASAAGYRAAHADWPARVAAEAALHDRLGADAVLTNVSYLPLAAAARRGRPAWSICSLNWADLFAHFFAGEPWAPPLLAEMRAAYASARAFLRVTPGMPMADLPQCRTVGVIARRGRRHDLGFFGKKCVLVGFGGIGQTLPVAQWPQHPGLHWLVPAAWGVQRPDMSPAEATGLDFTDVLCSVDAVLTKPGYGTFAEAAVNGAPLLYVRREDWPEQDCLIDWLSAVGRCREVSPAVLTRGDLRADLEALWAQPARPHPAADGAVEAADFLRADWAAAQSG